MTKHSEIPDKQVLADLTITKRVITSYKIILTELEKLGRMGDANNAFRMDSFRYEAKLSGEQKTLGTIMGIVGERGLVVEEED